MDASTVLKRRKKLNKKIKELKRKQDAMEKELKYLQNECKHEIIYKTPKKRASGNSLLSYYPPHYYCFLCQQYFDNIRRHIPMDEVTKQPTSAIIDLAEYPKLYSDGFIPIMTRMESIYKVAKMENEKDELSEQEIGQIIKDELALQEKDANM